MEIVWALDFDGVINANSPGWSAAPFKGQAYYLPHGTSYTIRWAPKLISRIRQVHKNPAVSIVWASSWCGHTEVLEHLVKLPTLLSAASSRMEGKDKEAFARSVVDSGRKLIWTDDEFTPQSGGLYDELTRDGNSLLITPSPQRGLQPSDLDAIDSFVLGSSL